MNKSLSIFTLIIIILFLSQQTLSYKCKPYTYNYTLLVLNWPSEYCYHHQSCKPNWKQLIPTNQWIISGFWPASLDVDFLNCIQFMGSDPNCNVQYSYNQSALNSALKVQLNTYCPQITTSNDIKSAQWAQHGTCYVSVIQTLNNSFIGKESQIFESYFRSPIQKVKQLKLSLTQQSYKNKNDLALSIGVKPEQFHALCEYDADYLSELKICYDLKSTVGNESLTSCPNQLPNQCEFPVKVRTQNGFYLHYFGLLLLILLGMLV